MSDEQIIKKINTVLEDIRPGIQMDGADLEFVSFCDGIVSLKLYGNCINCPMSFYTLKVCIEEKLKEHISYIHEVVAVN